MRLQNNSTPLLSSLKGGLQKYSRALVERGKRRSHTDSSLLPLQRWARHVGERQGNYFPINPQYKDCQGNKTYHIIKLNRVGTFNLNIKSVAQIS